MPKLLYNHILPFSADQLFDLVQDIESYPEFLPWIGAARIISKNDNELAAELIIKYHFVRTKYISKVMLVPKSAIIVELLDGPFKFLKNHWKFIPEGEQTHIEFMLEFELKSSALQKMITQELDFLTKKMIEAFITRAENQFD